MRGEFKERFWWESQPLISVKNTCEDCLLFGVVLWLNGFLFVRSFSFQHLPWEKLKERNKDYTNLCTFSHCLNHKINLFIFSLHEKQKMCA